MRDLAEQQRAPAPGRDPRETLEPMLDDIVRGLGYDKAVVLVYDESIASLRGLFGWNVTDDQARRLVIGVAGSDDPLVVALRTGAPRRHGHRRLRRGATPLRDGPQRRPARGRASLTEGRYPRRRPGASRSL